MSVLKEEVKYIAALAKLDFKEEELEEFTRHFNEILSYMDELNEVDTDNVEPLSHPIDGENIFREDVQIKSLDRDEAMKNAPETDGTYFIVPRIINTDTQ
jgi:aspartyl-tRNA(Asn)/glutamyl-tRNA(Gln) amidotransferase subunit C